MATTVVRMAQPRDVATIVSIVNGYAADSVMLPITMERVALSLDDFVVATDARGRVRACGALKEYSPSLAEVASLAVARDAHGSGIGRGIVAALEELARVRGIGELFALTLTAGFFKAVGYVVTERVRYPEKIRRDCSSCARRFGCAEICVARMLRADTLECAA
ncbi:MAG TPA: GNAT family N-acetyltransferase [Gemmatimonadaceae bacterium]|jgi:amino-acid N-acetyltransferase